MDKQLFYKANFLVFLLFSQFIKAGIIEVEVMYCQSAPQACGLEPSGSYEAGKKFCMEYQKNVVCIVK